MHILLSRSSDCNTELRCNYKIRPVVWAAKELFEVVLNTYLLNKHLMLSM